MQMSKLSILCPMCGGSTTVETGDEAAVCLRCGKPYVVKNAIVENYIRVTGAQNGQTPGRETADNPAGFEISGGVLNQYTGKSPDVVVPEGVTVIGENAFAGLKIKSIQLPESLQEIQGSAFSGCENLAAVIIPAGVTHIGDLAFAFCSGLKTVTLPAGVTNIGNRAFMLCKELKTVTISSGTDRAAYSEDPFDQIFRIFNESKDHGTGIGDYAFQDCSALTAVTIPGGVKRIHAYAFEGCRSLQEVVIPDGVRVIEEGAFKDCSSLTKVTIPDSIKCIDGRAFENAPLRTVVMKEGLNAKYPVGAPWPRPKVTVKKERRELTGRCRYCGGEFTRFFVSRNHPPRCKKCGRPKDYR